MVRRVLITGGAGFIGSHLADELLRHGYAVRALDNLSEQVHGPSATRPDYLSRDVELVTGVGQSMYEIARYTSANNLGTAVLLEALVEKPVERLVVASSMSLYGEGLYRTPDGVAVTAGRPGDIHF